MRGILTLVFYAFGLLFATLFCAALFGIANGESDIGGSFLLMSLLGGLITVSVLFSVSNQKPAVISRAESLLALVVIWLFLPMVASIPFIWSMEEMHFGIAMFEAISGITTTSASLMLVKTMPVTLIAWRALLEWLGGFYVLASVLFLLAPTGIGGIPQLRGFMFHETDGESFAIKQFGRLFDRYILATAIIFLLFLVLGTAPKLAILSALAGVSTGGYMPIEQDLFTLMPKTAQLLLAVVLLFAASGLMWQRQSLNKMLILAQKTREPIFMLVLVLIFTALYTNNLNLQDETTSWVQNVDHILEGFFAAASIVSTSGLETRFGIIQILPEIVVLIAVVVGGSIISNSGGIKFYRFAAMLTVSGRELERLLYPHGVSAKINRTSSWYSETSINAVWTVLISALIIIFLGTILLAFSGLSFVAAFSAAIAFFSNAGPIYTALTPPPGTDAAWLAYSDMSPLAHSVGVVLMLLGRLEIIVFLASLNPKYWFE